tara:strand:+ start:9166 stop:11193 length:2028 start_codon:yes stop_codon:yes gene_type:complete
LSHQREEDIEWSDSLAFREFELSYLEQARVVNQKESSPGERAIVRKRGKELQTHLQKLADFVLDALSSLRDDLQCYSQGLQGGKLPESLYWTLSRQSLAPKEDAQLYFLLREEGAEIGFGFALRHDQRQHETRKRFTHKLKRFHRKSDRYLESLLQHDYRLWSGPHLPFTTPSQTIEQWTQRPGVVVRLIPRDALLALQHDVAGVTTQIISECIGLYGFLDRVYTDVPHIRPMTLPSPDEMSNLTPEDDHLQSRDAAREWSVDFLNYARHRSFDFPADLIRTYYLSLQTRPFVILTGVAGTGKTKLAQMFAHFLTKDAEQHTGNPHIGLIPVRPNWLDPHGLLGYYDTLTAHYRSTPFLQLLLRAHHDPHNPYFAILDEMNLARVEYYFSDFLSVMESRRYDAEGQLIDQAMLHLHDEPDTIRVVDPYYDLLSLPPTLPVPPNLYITGTVNIDETTHRLSPKVLDRANVIEVKSPSPAAFFSQLYRRSTHNYSNSAPRLAQQRMAFIRQGRFTAPYSLEQLTLPPEAIVQLAAILDDLFALLEQHGFAFGLRLVQEVMDFAENHHRLEPLAESIAWVFDQQLLQKILPRLHGSRKRLTPLLSKLLLLCWPTRNDPKQRKQLITHPAPLQQVEQYRHFMQSSHKTPRPDLPHSAKKIIRMLDELELEPYIDFHLQR